MIVDILLGIPALLLLVMTIFSNWQGTAWWLRACEFPRVQILAAACVVALLSVVLNPDNRAWIVGGCLIVVVWQLIKVLPYTPLWAVDVGRTEATDAPSVTLLIANVLMPNRQSSGLLNEIIRCQPDIVLTLESDAWWQEQLDAALLDQWQWHARIPLDNLYGMHLYSRLPLEDLSIEYLIQDDIPSVHTWVCLDDQRRFRLHAVHPRPPAPGESKESLWRDAELMKVGQRIREDAAPAILAGDLNDVAWSRTTRQFCRVASMSDPRRGRGMFSSFHANWWFLRWPLDHLFMSKEFRLKRMERLPAFGSDHFPMLIEISFEPGRPQPDLPPQASAEELAEAEAVKQEGERKQQPQDEKSS